MFEVDYSVVFIFLYSISVKKSHEKKNKKQTTKKKTNKQKKKKTKKILKDWQE